MKPVYRGGDFLEVRVRASNGAFAGSVNVYVGPDRLRDLASELAGFPTSPGDAREVTLGSLDPEGPGGVRMLFMCTDSAARARLEIAMASGSLLGRSQSAAFSHPVEPAAVDRFVEQLRRIGESADEAAVLYLLPRRAPG